MQITVNADVLKDSLNKMLTVVDKKYHAHCRLTA